MNRFRSSVAASCMAVIVGCATPPPGPSPTATQTTAPSASSAPPVAVQPGEPWIVYEGPVPGEDSVGIMVIRRDGSGDHWAAPEAPIGSYPAGGDGWQLHPDWSPDGEQLAFVIDTPGPGHRDIWVSNADGSDARLVYDCQYPCDAAEFPAWSKDGASIMFVAWDHGDDRVSDGSRLELLNLASGEVETIAETKGPLYLAYPRWSPDGTRVVAQVDEWTNITEDSTFVSNKIVVIDLAVSPPAFTTLTEAEDWASHPDWHPTEDLIVFGTGRWPDVDTVGELYTIRPDGTELILLVGERERAVQPTWLPDGSGVIFALVDGTGFGTPNMTTVLSDGTGITSATSDRQRFGTHPRLRPLP